MKTTVKDGAFGAFGGRRTVGALAVAGTSLLAFAVSPGLRADLVGFAALAGDAYAAGVEGFVLSFGAFAPVVYFFAMVAQVFVAPIPSGPFSLVGALVFGVWEGLALGLAGSVVGSVLVFLAVRRWGEVLVARLVGREVVRRYVGVLDRRGWWMLAVLLVPFMPDDAAVALAGLSALGFRRFLVMLVLGRTPSSAMTALLASDWVTGSTATWVTAGIVVAAVMALGLAFRGRLEAWMLRRAALRGEGTP
ncbi:hypothetical protein GBA65_01740 [Rubrobacter marinus]|uniref:TVP38/TMEM64 family membrane protein n=1 Tax=Rubrobacter marinus TaxID=2653852 RepID=A0A6G8PSG6_9ACTN|nr:TVP38/TMEM64 family protein [Rubrobacter marinus]QIN77438.1 hypothetical protein GBA65_01740 [Rubrobacter marinus]